MNTREYIKSDSLMTKNLGPWLAVDLEEVEYNTGCEYIITLYKRWSKGEGLEATEWTHTTNDKANALATFKEIRLGNVYKVLGQAF